MQRVGELELLRLVGRGGSASVYEAVDRRHARRVAVKVYDRRGFDEASQRSVRRELQAVASLGDHPNVLPVYTSGFTEEGAPYVAMPIVAAGTLADRLERGEALQTAQVLDYGIKLAAALETGHRRGVLHRDIKPSNVYISPALDPLLGDVGITSIAGSTVPGNRLASARMYTAPEVVQSSPPTRHSDLYSLGATLLAMIEGEVAPEQPALQQAVPEPLRRIVSDMTASTPGERPASAAEVIERLQGVQARMGLAVTPALIGATTSAAAFTITGPAIADEANTPAPATVGAASGVAARKAARTSQQAAEVGIASSAGDAVLSDDGGSEDRPRRRQDLLLAAAASVLVLGAVAIAALFSLRSDDTNVVVGDATPTEIAVPQDDEVAGAANEAPAATSPPAEPTVAPSASDATEAGVSTEAAVPVDPESTEEGVEPLETNGNDESSEADAGADGAIGTSSGGDGDAIPDDGGSSDDEGVDPESLLPQTIIGRVVSTDGSSIAGTTVERFLASETGSKGASLGGFQVATDGTFGFTADVGCYVLTFVAPEGTAIVGASGEVPICVEDVQFALVVERSIQAAQVADAGLAGRISRRPLGFGEENMRINIYLTDDSGVKGALLGATETDELGVFAVAVPEGCYILTYLAPDGLTMVGGDETLDSAPLCVASGESIETAAELE